MTRKLPADIASPEDRGAVRPDMVSTGAFTFSDWSNLSIVFHSRGKEVLRITPEGELVFSDATEAAAALHREWDRIRGAPLRDEGDKL
jgi:hypothetical protein